MAGEFVTNHAGWRRLLRGLGAQAATAAVAGRMATGARAIAPVLTGRYRSSIHAKRKPGAVASSAVVADTDYAAVIEARKHVLRRQLRRRW